MDFQTLQSNWQRMGESDPYWAVSTAPQYAGNHWAPDDFFATGRNDVAHVLVRARIVFPTLGYGSALDFGCGLGRLSQALADHFEQVIGVDVAPSMVKKANELNRFDHRVQYILNERDDLAQLDNEAFDLVYSEITLMHMAPRYSQRYIQEFYRVVKPGGLVVFQLPAPTIKQRIKSLIPHVVLDHALRLRTRNRPRMEIYGRPRNQVGQLIRRAGGVVLDVQEQGALHGAPADFRYYSTTS